ncbi:MAG: D-aminoacylase [Anaerolineae bacterium]|nr:D-aminoacylase [Anaerolineae bacterium]
MLDYLIRNGRIVDGTGNPWFRADIGIAGGRIAAIRHHLDLPARHTIEAEGLTVCPGFIDMHAHSDWWLLTNPLHHPKLLQGVTTELLGQDGFSLAPWPAQEADMLRRLVAGMNGNPDLAPSWQSFAGYLEALNAARPSVNALSLVGHGTLRVGVVGMANRPASAAELAEMERLLHQSMEEGAAGLSSGLIYAPCYFAQREELVRLCRVVAGYGGIFVVHLRSEGDRLLEALEEVLDIAAESGVALHVSHFKVFGRPNWGKSILALERLERAREAGIDVTFDQYPYTAGSTSLSVLLPPWAHEGGAEALLARLQDPAAREQMRRDMEQDTSWDNFLAAVGPENIFITWVGSERNRWAVGKSLLAIAGCMHKPAAEAVMDLLWEEQLAVTMVDFCMSEEDVERIMRHPLQMVSTDGLLAGRPHPRAYGAYPRVLGHYVRERRLLPLQEAVRKMTSLPAQRLGLRDRGLVREGYWADLVIFDPAVVADLATYEAPCRHPAGITHVFVNGVLSAAGGEHLGQRAGRALECHTPY